MLPVPQGHYDPAFCSFVSPTDGGNELYNKYTANILYVKFKHPSFNFHEPLYYFIKTIISLSINFSFNLTGIRTPAKPPLRGMLRMRSAPLKKRFAFWCPGFESERMNYAAGPKGPTA